MAAPCREKLIMTRERLRELLDELRDELAASGDLDHDARQALAVLSEDIDRRVSDEIDTGPAPLRELGDAALRLEARHPRLAQLLGQIGDTLGKLGI